ARSRPRLRTDPPRGGRAPPRYTARSPLMSAPPPGLPPHYTIARSLHEQFSGRGLPSRLLHQEDGAGAVVILDGPAALVLVPEPLHHIRFLDRGDQWVLLDLAADDALAHILNHYRTSRIR